MPAASHTSVIESCVAPRRESAAIAPSRMRCRLRPLAPAGRRSSRVDESANTASTLGQSGQIMRLGVVARHMHSAIHVNDLAGYVAARLRTQKYGDGRDIFLGIADPAQWIHGGRHLVESGYRAGQLLVYRAPRHGGGGLHTNL